MSRSVSTTVKKEKKKAAEMDNEAPEISKQLGSYARIKKNEIYYFRG